MAIHLKLLRVQAGLTLEKLATDSGLTRSFLSKVERGISTPSIDSAMKISNALGVSVDRLFGQNAGPGPVTIVRAQPAGTEGRDNHLSLVAGINPDRVMRAFVLKPSESSGRKRIMSHHDGEEILFVLSGKIELLIEKQKEVLNVGDCVQFDSALPHKLTSLDDKVQASALVVVANRQGRGH